MLPNGLNVPNLRDPHASAFAACLDHVFHEYDVVGLLATGTIVRGAGDSRSDLDIHVLQVANFRERVQLRFHGVPCEIFVNPAHRVPAYFEEDRLDRRPVAPHMYATGVIVYDPEGIVAKLADEAKAILDNPPPAPTATTVVQMRYGVATEFEDVDDLAERDPAAAAVLLGGVVRRLAECRVALEAGWLPRAKDLMPRLRYIDPEAAALAERAASDVDFQSRLAAARSLCLRAAGADGFFEWRSPREEVLPPVEG